MRVPTREVRLTRSSPRAGSRAACAGRVTFPRAVTGPNNPLYEQVRRACHGVAVHIAVREPRPGCDFPPAIHITPKNGRFAGPLSTATGIRTPALVPLEARAGTTPSARRRARHKRSPKRTCVPKCPNFGHFNDRAPRACGAQKGRRPMTVVDLNDTPFLGRTVSLSRLAPHKYSLDCRKCGSSLRGRFLGVIGSNMTWRCRCGAARRVKVER